jgi:hypothetical protein
MNKTNELKYFYEHSSKHSNYQILPTALKHILRQDDLHIKTRYESERLRFILERIEIAGKSVLDIGGNTGYFSFELLDAGAQKVTHYEGNKEHSKFVELAAQVTGNEKKLEVINGYFDFDGRYKSWHDIVLLLNVLHHVGDDYGETRLDINDAKKLIIDQLNSLSGSCETLILQIGYNWHGNAGRPLFEFGTKKEVIEFIQYGIVGSWEISSIGIAESKNSSILFRDPDAKNIERDDTMGEFLNRPIFILRSKRCQKK